MESRDWLQQKLMEVSSEEVRLKGLLYDIEQNLKALRALKAYLEQSARTGAAQGVPDAPDAAEA
ncbi:MAG TPA: hypothetical protein VF226_04805 [Hyphomicrobiaceae bacterium]